MKTGTVVDETIGRVALARFVNMTCGAAVVTPWDVYELPDEMIDAITAYGEALGRG